MKRPILIILALLLVSACKKTPLNTTEIIKFENAAPLSSPADNITLVTLTVDLPGNTDPQTQVVFTTDLGTFVNSNSQMITVSIDGNAKATVQLKSGTTGTATVKAAVAAAYATSSTVNFTAPNPDNIFTIAPYTDNIAADGMTTMVLTAAIIKTLPASAQSVTFTADNNATFSNNMGSMSIPADVSGNAIAYLKKATEGPVHVTLTDQGVTRNLTVTFIAPDVNNIFTIAPFTDNISADGVSTMVLTALVNKKLPVAAQNVTFTADNAATFSNSTPTTVATADGAGNAIAYLKKSVEGPVHVTMTSGGGTRNLTVNFVRALPDAMILSSNPSLTAGFPNTLAITIQLNKNIGKPATGYTFTYNAFDSSNNIIGVFNNGNASDANGTATVNFSTGTSPYKGTVKIIISVMGNAGINASTNIVVN